MRSGASLPLNCARGSFPAGLIAQMKVPVDQPNQFVSIPCFQKIEHPDVVLVAAPDALDRAPAAAKAVLRAVSQRLNLFLQHGIAANRIEPIMKHRVELA